MQLVALEEVANALTRSILTRVCVHPRAPSTCITPYRKLGASHVRLRIYGCQPTCSYPWCLALVSGVTHSSVVLSTVRTDLSWAKNPSIHYTAILIASQYAPSAPQARTWPRHEALQALEGSSSSQAQQTSHAPTLGEETSEHLRACSLVLETFHSHAEQ